MRKLGLGLLGVVSFLFVGAAVSQADTALMKARIPFDFVVGTKTLPAGDYTILKNANSADLIRSDDGRNAVFFVTVSLVPKTEDANKTAVVFDKIGNVYFMRTILVGSWTDGLQLPQPKRERELLAEGSHAPSQQIAVGNAGR
jgi:hypothetical protein